jgi:hypothetical protein
VGYTLRHNRQRKEVLRLAPNFSDPTACLRGQQQLMSKVWSEHPAGGRARVGFPIMRLVECSNERECRAGVGAQISKVK